LCLVFYIIILTQSVIYEYRLSLVKQRHLVLLSALFLFTPTAAAATVAVLFIVCAYLSQLRQTEIVNCFPAPEPPATAQVQDKQSASWPQDLVPLEGSPTRCVIIYSLWDGSCFRWTICAVPSVWSSVFCSAAFGICSPVVYPCLLLANKRAISVPSLVVLLGRV